ncbi:MAG: HEAT repeat domain-containing protein, partial [Planctomycetota bacterium]|nr:HEAT repeat domain-containing protein [Planctomycetota bacterium]
MKRILIGALLVTVALLVFADDLMAHGGQYRGPGGAVPPNQREPSDPTPPQPPPPSGPPVTPPPTTPDSKPTAPTPTTPAPTPTTPQPTTPNLDPKTKGARGSLGFENWVFWYHNNKADIENLKKALYTRVSSENPLFQIGGKNRSNRSDATHDIRAKVESDILPALIWAMDPKNGRHQDVTSATYIAIGKMAKTPEQIELIKKGLDPKMKHDLIVQESACVGLGMLRRANPDHQFDAGELDKVREFLFGVFEDAGDDYQTRTRAFALMAIGLLGDQPSGSGSYSGHAATTARLFQLMEQDYNHPDLLISILTSIGLQPPTSITEAQRDVLRECLAKGRIGRNDVQPIHQSYASLTLGRIGTAKDLMVLQRAMTNRRIKDKNIQRSCAIGLGQLGRLVSGEDRIAVAQTLLSSMGKVKDPSARNFAIISLSDLIIADVKQGKTDVIGGTKAGEFLLQMAEDGKYIQRPFGALALGLVGRAITDETTVPVYGEFRSKSLEILRNGLQTKKLDKRGRAAFATALGIIKDMSSVKDLVKIVADEKGDTEFRGYAALALGLIGQGTRDVLTPIREALKERRSEELRQQTATALGLLQDKEGVPLLLEELRRAKSQNVKGQVVLALAKIGDARAVAPMIALLKDTKGMDLTRALACAGLGVIGDLEWLPSLSRITLDLNYRASTDAINEIA